MPNQVQDNSIRHQIVIADDHALVRGGLELVVKMSVPNSDIFQTNSFDETIKILSEKPSIDLLLLDLMMPGMDGEKSILNIINLHPGVPIVIVSVKEDFDSLGRCPAAPVGRDHNPVTLVQYYNASVCHRPLP